MAKVEKRSSQTAKEGKPYRTAVRSFGLRLRKLRQERGLTLEVAAEKSSLDWKHFQKLESGAINFTLVTLTRISKGLKVSLQELFTGVE